MSEKKFYVNVTDLALCQKCPALYAYKIFKHEKNAWRVGLTGDVPKGKTFHDEIAKVFFTEAANPKSPFHEKIIFALAEKDFHEFEKVIKEDIFFPFLERGAKRFSSERICAFARGVGVWVRAMWEFLSGIPSMRENSRFVFHEPEKKLRATYNFEGGKMIVVGCYDALLFNPDAGEARLFEFKGHGKSDVTVPLAQSLVYAWMIWKHSGIIPAVEIIYLSGEVEIITPAVVRELILKLPGLLQVVIDVYFSRSVPEFSRDKNTGRANMARHLLPFRVLILHGPQQICGH